MTGSLRTPDAADLLLTVTFSGRSVALWPEVEGTLSFLAAPTLPPGGPPPPLKRSWTPGHPADLLSLQPDALIGDSKTRE